MRIELLWLNCLWLLLPLLIWNVAVTTRITIKEVISDSYSPGWLLMAENLTRILVFAFPILVPLQVTDHRSRIGLVLYLGGTLIYFATWIQFLLAPDAERSHSTMGLLAPRLTPILPFLGIALIGCSVPYAFISALFVTLHTWHGVQNLRA